MATCTGCGTELATADVLYSPRGEVVCAACTDKAGLADDERKAGRNIRRAAVVSAVGGVFGFCALSVAFGLGFYAGAIAAVSSGLFALNGLVGADAERFTKTMTASDRGVAWIGLAIGLGLSIYETLAFAGVMPFHLWIH
ncbi:MAG TPA: hypothetical protein VH143_22840 [Kofleriaceae bacterium]|jgi:hypothetical protein|nr:hypothetical protein [Kofleriaceae bacterium]